MFDALCSVSRLREAFERVSANDGAPGGDGVTIARFARQLDTELATLADELRRDA